MATKKKTKTKAKTAKKTKKKGSTAKKPAKKVARTRAPAKGAARKSAKARPKGARKPAPAPQAAAPAPPPGERVGTVVHYYGNLSVAIIQLETGTLRVGDMIHIRGHTSDFAQRIDSMEIDHVHVDEAGPGKSFGVRVKEHAREHDVVYKVTQQ